MKLDKFPKNPLGSPQVIDPINVLVGRGNQPHLTRNMRSKILPNTMSRFSNGTLVGVIGDSNEELTRERVLELVEEESLQGYDVIGHKVDDNISPIRSLTYKVGRRTYRIEVERRDDDKFYLVRRN